MESVESYLHKKFKKQLSVISKLPNNKENKDAAQTEHGEEKTYNHETPKETKTDDEITIVYRSPSVSDQTAGNSNLDNNNSVPNQSTNSPSFMVNTNYSKSSISVENQVANQQSSNSYISYVVSNQSDHQPASFDTKFSEQTNYTVSLSSILDNVYSRQSYSNSEDTYPQHNNVDDYPPRLNSSDEMSDQKLEEVQRPPDKNTNGKYVCPYCSLVCSKPSVLQKHIRAHTNERPYPCKSCGFSFKTRSNLYKHCRSRTHANRVMGNKTQETGSESESRNHSPNHLESKEEQASLQKPYKPRFHTGTPFFDNISKENIEEEGQNGQNPTSELLSLHISEIINKNNSIVNSNDTYTKKRFVEELRYGKAELAYPNIIEQKTTEEPLNLTNKSRKRSMSEVAEPLTQKSLIKELLLKNLSSSDMQCPYCKMIFQTVTELDVHKYRSCKGKPSGARYTRSSSVNVASILTQNKNAFDNIPQLQNTVFPLNSPGPFLGKTRLIDADKSKSFSFDGGNLPLLSPSEPSPNYLLSPLSFDKEKKPGIKLFGGEVKVHSSGETKSFKIDAKEDKYESESKFIEYGGKISESRVVQSTLQSGGTCLTNKTNYKKQDLNASQEVMGVFDGTTPSPRMDMSNFSRNKFTFDSFETMPNTSKEMGFREQPETPKSYKDEPSPLYKSFMDFSQTALRKLTPNLRQPSYPGTGLPLPSSPLYNNISGEKLENLRLSSPKPKMTELPRSPLPLPENEKFLNNRKAFYEPKPITPTNLYNPLNLLVNGKVVRHVPGMPGPVVAPEPPADMAYRSNIVAVVRPMQQSMTPLSPLVLDRFPSGTKTTSSSQPKEKVVDRGSVFLQPEKVPERLTKSPNNFTQPERIRPTYNLLQVKAEVAKENPKADNLEVISNVPSKSAESKPLAWTSEPVKTVENRLGESETKKFARPSSLALKPTMASLKQHHGLTPTMFNQILISPETPRVAKKYAEHYLHGNYFSYLGLKSSTKPVYCTLNKTQPFYVPHFKKLSMYSEWRQQDTKQDKLYVSNYDSRQKSGRYSVAGNITADLITHSSYKFMVSETTINAEKGDEPQKNNAVMGGYECNEDYTYIRGRGRGRYVCDQCGIRCKKPSMLKKHIRTHSNDRPYTCSHCNFSFKTKGNLTKHMKSKAHSKNSTASSSSSCSTQQSVHSSDSDTDDSGMDSSDESTRQQEHEAAYGLLSLSQKPSNSRGGHCDADLAHLRSVSPNELLMTPEEIAYVSKTNYAKNKILDERNSGFRSKKLNEVAPPISTEETTETRNVRNYLGSGCVSRPLTYPYTSAIPNEEDMLPSPRPSEIESMASDSSVSPEPKSIKQFHVIQRYLPNCQLSPKLPEAPAKVPPPPPPPTLHPRKVEVNYQPPENVVLNNKKNVVSSLNRTLPTLKINDVVITTESLGDLRKRKFSASEINYKNKVQRNDEVMDLSMTTVQEKVVNGEEERIVIEAKPVEPQKNVTNEIYNVLQKAVPTSPSRLDVNEDRGDCFKHKAADPTNNNGTVIILRPLQAEEQMNINYASEQHNNSDDQGKISDYDNSAMETLADIATKQVKLEKNTLAKSVATEFLKLATKNEGLDGCRESVKYGPVNKDVNDIIVKSEGNKSCTICAKSFNKPSQLRLHMNIHYLERPFRCDSCSVSFRTKGHLQKHERSASHHNKLSSSPALSSSEPRPFKCSDCNIAFRIHGHLAKHLRSKMHIMKLECLAKIPFGLYAELERSNSLLTEINTCDGDQCLESLKILARKVFINDPNKLNTLELREDVIAD
ncbi:hypothetical protein JTB14_020075 [Gonioctena quinquepunctata]|nr:hypothetical protein JTB14_020075 [Gonioctena quinquepunctata]